MDAGHGALRVVGAWHEALNAGDAGRLVALSHPDVEMVGPRGSVRGRIVVVEAATWHDAETGEKTGGATVATAFTLEGGLVASIARHDDEGLEYAPQNAGDEVSSGNVR